MPRGSAWIPFLNSRRDWSSVVWAEEGGRRERRKRRRVRGICSGSGGAVRWRGNARGGTLGIVAHLVRNLEV